MFDKKYLLWRLNNPSDQELYNYHLDYILNKYNLDKDIFNKKSEERLKQILKKVHKLKNDEILKYPLNIYYENIERENEILKNEITQIKNSKGWKLIEKIRNLKNKVRR